MCRARPRSCLRGVVAKAGRYSAGSVRCARRQKCHAGAVYGEQGRCVQPRCGSKPRDAGRRRAGAAGRGLWHTCLRTMPPFTMPRCGQADAVLCDVPCSGLGVLAKKPDIRQKSLEGAGWTWYAVQRAILETPRRLCEAGRAARVFHLHA